MKQTENYGLKLLEFSDAFSPKPLNENAEAIDAALTEVNEAAGACVRMAFGSYVGSGTRSVTIQTPGFKAQAVLMRNAGTVSGSLTNSDAVSVKGGWCMWLGADLAASYGVYATVDGETKRETVATTILFTATHGTLTWKVPALPSEYTDVREDNGPNAANNSSGVTYEYIAFGVAE